MKTVLSDVLPVVIPDGAAGLLVSVGWLEVAIAALFVVWLGGFVLNLHAAWRDCGYVRAVKWSWFDNLWLLFNTALWPLSLYSHSVERFDMRQARKLMAHHRARRTPGPIGKGEGFYPGGAGGGSGATVGLGSVRFDVGKVPPDNVGIVVVLVGIAGIVGLMLFA
jgi:hypothetical protein